MKNRISAVFSDNKKKLMCLSSAMNLVKILTAESQKNSKIFNLIDNFFLILKKKNWIKEYIYWELNLLKLIGYDLDLINIVNEEIINSKIKYFVQSNTEKKFVPYFLVHYNQEDIDESDLLKGLVLVGDYLDKTILKPNNINYPISRLHFVNILK